MSRRAGPQLALDDVVRAAAAVLDREGYDGLTMRAVAAELGVQAPALYWHVKNKDELSLRLFDHLIDGIDYDPPSGNWRADMLGMAERLRRRLVGVRDITRLFPENYADGPRAIRSMEMALGALREAGLPAREALHAYGAALSFIVGWSRFEVTRRANARLPWTSETPTLAKSSNLAWAIAEVDGEPDYDEGFRYGVELLISGLERRLA